MKLIKLELAGFKLIHQCSIELNTLNIFVGTNGVGKSSFISFFKLLNRMMSNNLQEYIAKLGSIESLFHQGLQPATQITATLYFASENDENAYHLKWIAEPHQTLTFIEESLFFTNQGKLNNSVSFGTGHQESKLADPETQGKTARSIKTLLQHCRVYSFQDTSHRAYVRRSANVSDNRYLMHDGGNLAAVLFHLRRDYPENYQKIQEVIRTAFPSFEDFVLELAGSNKQIVTLRLKERGLQKNFTAAHLSDGLLRMLCLTTLLSQPELPAIIVIDEPELGLHPRAINLLADLLGTASRHAQIIISTHSVELVDQFVPEKTIVVERSQQGALVFKRLLGSQLEEWLEKYAMGEF
jgi:predicted ATPase